MKDKEETKVIFRKWQGDIIALFPEEVADMDFNCCNSYQHVGQHGAANPQGIIWHSKLAKPEEYADLKEELESMGYNLKVVKRYTQDMKEVRYAALEKFMRTGS